MDQSLDSIFEFYMYYILFNVKLERTILVNINAPGWSWDARCFRPKNIRSENIKKCLKLGMRHRTYVMLVIQNNFMKGGPHLNWSRFISVSEIMS